jgi:hypothetical protein
MMVLAEACKPLDAIVVRALHDVVNLVGVVIAPFFGVGANGCASVSVTLEHDFPAAFPVARQTTSSLRPFPSRQLASLR